ncbi:MAG: response regulator [Treponema sp.]|jgi:signal transduction histidine kinase/CheY-like chemotaxis protein|nr:response regulator [Treponema sp.]
MVVVFYQWNEKNIIRRGGNGPLYRNLMEQPAYVRRGFNHDEITTVPLLGVQWKRFTATQLRIMDSPLSDLPRRTFLSPWGKAAEEFTILFHIEMDNAALSFLAGTGKTSSGSALPGIFLSYIGENWEIYFNGKLVRSEIHLDETSQIKSRRNWRDVYFPMGKDTLVLGTNILAIRILGDPAFGATGLYYSSPYYIDDYQIIEGRQHNFLLITLIGIFGFIGFYYLILFLSVRKREQIFNLYYSIFSFLLCVYSIMRNGIVNSLIPNSDISIRLEFLSLFMMIPMLCFFIEELGRRKVTKISRVYFWVCVFFSVTQIFFCAQYGADVLKLWNASVLIYFSYVFFYDIIYFYFREQRRSRIHKNTGEAAGIVVTGNEQESFFLSILIGSVLVYACGIVDILDVQFFHNSIHLFLYSVSVFHIGMAFALSERFRGMYSRLEQSNVILETTVTERTRELKEQTVIAVRANQAKRDFLAAMSHEIRSPLNAVIGLSEIELRSDRELKLLSESSRENIAQIHQSGSFLLEVVGDILDISKIEEGKFELDPAEYDTAEMISGIANICRVRIAVKPVNFVLEIKGDFPAKLIGDELRVKQILNNLLSNAAKYTNEGTIQLTINSEPLTNENVLVCFAVRDTGIGIQTGDMEKLFDNYSQLDSKTNRRTEGTGLGLSIAKNLAELMSGSIRAESEYGKGSVFTAEIIQGIDGSADVTCNAASIGEETAEALRNFNYTGSGKETDIVFSRRVVLSDARVLVVDDKPVNLLVARGLLKPYGLIMDTASSGQEAIEKAKAVSYDLIFMDHMMPEMDGIETLKEIRNEESSKNIRQVPIVALTANALRDMREYYLEHGFNDYLSKPIDPKMLNDVLVKWIPGKSNGVAHGKNNELMFITENFAEEVATQRLEMLNHISAAFASRREIDSDYFKQFTDLIKSINTDSGMKEQADILLTAGQQEDALKIRETLPAFCQTMNNRKNNEHNATNIDNILLLVKRAILDGDAKNAGILLAELGSLKLDPGSRELYFTLYDSLVELKLEKALDVIHSWERLSND